MSGKVRTWLRSPLRSRRSSGNRSHPARRRSWRRSGTRATAPHRSIVTRPAARSYFRLLIPADGASAAPPAAWRARPRARDDPRARRIDHVPLCGILGGRRGRRYRVRWYATDGVLGGSREAPLASDWTTSRSRAPNLSSASRVFSTSSWARGDTCARTFSTRSCTSGDSCVSWSRRRRWTTPCRRRSRTATRRRGTAPTTGTRASACASTSLNSGST